MSSGLNSAEKYKQSMYFLWIQRFTSAFAYVSVGLEISVALNSIDWYNVAEKKPEKICISKYVREDNGTKNSKELMSGTVDCKKRWELKTSISVFGHISIGFPFPSVYKW